jgi:hypothetical protein
MSSNAKRAVAEPVERRAVNLPSSRNRTEEQRNRHKLRSVTLRHVRIPVLPFSFGFQCPHEHNKRRTGRPDAGLPVERRMGDLSNEGRVEGERAAVLSRHPLPIRRVHALLAPPACVLCHEHHCAVHSALRARHDRLLSATGSRREDFARNFRPAGVLRLPADGRREYTANVATRSNYR